MGYHVVIAGGETGHQDGQVVGLGAGIDEIAHAQIAGQGIGQGLAVFGDDRVVVNGGGVMQGFHLLPGGLHHFGMAVAHADGHDAAEAVQVTASGLIEKILHGPLHDHEGLFVVGHQGR